MSHFCHAKCFTALMDKFVEAAPALMYSKDRSGRYMFVNKAFVDSCRDQGLDVTHDDIVGKTDRELWPEVAATYEANDEETWQEGLTHSTKPGAVEDKPFYVTQFIYGERLGGIALDIGQVGLDLADSLGLNGRLLQSLESSAAMLKALEFINPDKK